VHNKVYPLFSPIVSELLSAELVTHIQCDFIICDAMSHCYRDELLEMSFFHAIATSGI